MILGGKLFFFFFLSVCTKYINTQILSFHHIKLRKLEWED